MPTIDVCVATFRRPELLRTLLESLLAQETQGELEFTISIADNDAGRSAEPVVREFAHGPIKITYDVEPEQNISLARNRSMSHGAADYIATIDDDNYADRRWLLNLCRAARSYGADVVHGPVVPEFPAGTPDYIRDCYIFVRPNPATGYGERYILTTANSLFKRALIDGVEAPFDPAFGLSGGGDAKFFRELRARGCRMMWCREAPVFSPVPRSRATIGWVVQRSFRLGNVRARLRDGRTERRGQTTPRKSIVARAAGSARRAILDPKRNSVLWLTRIAFNLGVLAHSAGYRYEEYRRRGKNDSRPGAAGG